jgi:hypothetical protein
MTQSDIGILALQHFRTEAALKRFCRGDDKRLKRTGLKLSACQGKRSTGNIMVTLLAIAVVVEIAIIVAEIGSKARILARLFAARRAAV